MAKRHVFIIGMPGSGKTYWAKQLSAHYNVPWVDLDRQIEQAIQLPINKIFETKGESFFRNIEREQLHKAVADSHALNIVSCGGGTPCFFDNMHVMKQHGVVIYLEADVLTLIQRLQKNYRFRPLLKDDLQSNVVRLLAERSAVYLQAHYTLSAVDCTLNDLIKIIDPCTKQDG